MSELIRKQYDVSILLYHIVCPAKYRKAIFTKDVDEKLKEICEVIALRYEIEFLEIGTDDDHVHFFVQSVPMYSPKKIMQIIKSITAREIFKQMPEVKKQLWGGQFWSDGYFVSTVGAHSSEEVIRQYVKNQGVSQVTIQPRLF
ncbi:MAG: IS200/IS605 family transposase [Pyrinomonadaceae bacterium]|nr:IS200/IS605 family transposase [Pyrinomonadaceae bacterium]